MSRNSPAENAFAALFILFAASLAAALLFIIAIVKAMPVDYLAISGSTLAFLVLMTYLSGKRYARLQDEEDAAEREWIDGIREKRRGKP